jgi:hypothetical protein
MVLGGLVACVVAIRPQPVAANVPVEAHLFGRAFLKPR